MTQEIAAPVSRGEVLGGGYTRVMGVLNVTPDSFSDGGKWLDPKAAIAQALRMFDEGAFIVDVGGESTRPFIVDVGGESTRPGATRVTAEEEWDRVSPVIHALTSRDLAVSIDTVNSEVARRAVFEGAVLINDVSGGVHDPKMAEVSAYEGVAMVVQHWRGFPADPNLNQTYRDVVEEVGMETMNQVQALCRLGVPAEALVLDPGLGFAKGTEDSWSLMENLEVFTSSGFPVLVGASRKRFVVAKYSDPERGTLETTKKAVQAGVWAVRVHDVGSSVRLIEELS